MDWHFLKSDPAGDVNTASHSRSVIEGDRTVSALEIFVREVLQNSLDAAVRDGNGVKKVTVTFRMHNLQENNKRSVFLQTIDWPKMKEHIASANRFSTKRMERYRFPDPMELIQKPIQMLEICEMGTIGLVGPERIAGEQDEESWQSVIPKAYIALCRDDARREKQTLGSGGTYGLGKAALWRASAIQTVFFFSRLYSSSDTTLFRAAAQTRLCTHYVGQTQYRGLGFGGQMKPISGSRESFCAPLCNDAAINFGRKLGTGIRDKESESGTSIFIPFWDQPEPDDDDVDLPATVLFAKYAARFFWPAIIENRLEVIATDGNLTVNARDHFVHYHSFIELYQRMTAGNKGEKDAPAENIHFVVPKGPPPLPERETESFVKCGVCTVEANDITEDLVRRVACIRGQGMVIGYQKVTGNTVLKPFIGLALGGRTIDKSKAGIRGDMLLGYSESVTHTRWDGKAESLSSWPTASSSVKKLLGKIREYFERHSRLEVPESTGDLSPLREGLKFPGSGSTREEKDKVTGIPKLRKHRFDCEGSHYNFEIRSKIKPGEKPLSVIIWIEAGLETGSAKSKADRFTIANLRTIPSILESEDLGNGKWQIQIPVLATETEIRISGQTEDLDLQLFSVTEALLRAKIAKADEPEQPAIEIMEGAENA